jgi:anti-anti-sigma factor
VPLDQVPFFDAFLSYSSKDKKLVDEIARRLAADGVDVFFDDWFIEPGHHVRKALLEALRKSRKVVACMTPHYFQSTWADFELNWNFVETQLGKGIDTPLVPLLLRACEIPRETTVLRRIDLTGEHLDAGYQDLLAVLSRTDALVVEAYVVPSGPGGRYLGDFVSGKLKSRLGFPESRVHDFLVVYDELVQNAFHHARKKRNRVEASVRAHADEVVLEVSDDGPGFDLAGSLRALRDARSSDPALLGLRGLQLINELSDRVASETRNRRHVMTVHLRREKMAKDTASLVDIGATGSSWRQESGGPSFLRFIDPSGRYACLAVKVPRIDHHNADDMGRFFGESLGGRSFTRVVVECSAVEYIGSVGLRALAQLGRQVRAGGGTCALVVKSPRVQELLEISRFALIFDVRQSFHDALGALA